MNELVEVRDVSPELMDRFWAKVIIEEGGCWLWIGARRDGYGVFYVAGPTLSAHRFSHEQFVGPIPDGLFVLHHCDNPACVNPEHLFTGTHRDNMRDMVAKQRQILGEKNARSKLTEDDVRAIRRACADGESRLSVSKRYRVHKNSIQKIMGGTRWTHVA